MAHRLHVPGRPSRTLRWTHQHPAVTGGVLLFKHRSERLSGETFRQLRDELGAWLETDRPFAVREALGFAPEESLGEPTDPEIDLDMGGPKI